MKPAKGGESLTRDLGAHPELSLSSKSLEPNKALSNMLNDIGNTLRPEDSDYIGSFCTHLYTQDKSLGDRYEVFYAHHATFPKGMPASGVLNTAVKDLSIHLLKLLGIKKPATRDKRDKR